MIGTRYSLSTTDEQTIIVAGESGIYITSEDIFKYHSLIVTVSCRSTLHYLEYNCSILEGILFNNIELRAPIYVNDTYNGMIAIRIDSSTEISVSNHVNSDIKLIVYGAY